MQLFKSHSAIIVLVFSILLYACKSTDTSVTPSTASITAITCGSTIFSANPVNGTAFTGITSVPYTGGNGVAYSVGSAVASTGVTGLTATLAAGTLASGAGNATFAITGTPASVGIATFAISLGGQSCNLALTVNAATTTGGGSTGTVWSFETDLANIVKAAEAFKATLNATQVASLQYAYTKSQAQLWSNLPQSLYRNRVGLATSTFSATQWTAFYNLLKVSTGLGINEGNEEFVGIIDAVVDAVGYNYQNGQSSALGLAR